MRLQWLTLSLVFGLFSSVAWARPPKKSPPTVPEPPAVSEPVEPVEEAAPAHPDLKSEEEEVSEPPSETVEDWILDFGLDGGDLWFP